MAGLAELIHNEVLNIHLISEKWKKILVRKIGVIEKDIVIGVCNYRIAVALVEILYLFG